jgi:tRNA (cytidine/uridine-2'-O-)-methyltransferase
MPASYKPFFRVVLVEPENTQNTGNIGRTCVGTQCELHLCKPYGFEISDRTLKRAGLDYWQHLSWFEHDSFESWRSQVEDPSRVFYFSTKSKKTYWDVEYQRGDWLVFGRETKGLGEAILAVHPDQNLIIPQSGPVRSLNVSTAVAIAVYEGLRQLGES